MNTKPNEELREALKKDYRVLYVKQFTTDWEAQRLIRELEIDIMSLENLQSLIQTEIAEAERRASEIFIPVKGYEGVYEVSNTGKVRSLPRKTSKGGELKQATVQGGYKRVSLSNGSRKGYTVHRLVGMAFLSNPLNKPCINHIDGNPSNNNVSNLEWCTYAENSQHSFNVLGQKPWNKDFGQYRTSPCKQCGKDYTVRETRWTQEYCSKGCATSSRYTKEGA